LCPSIQVDILIEVNTAAITALDIVKRRIDAAKLPPGKPYTMEPNFGCTSPTLMRRAVKKLYGY
jgi:histone deacetylase complex regulatory component SIN3